ncbi:hypothetical protein CANINC_002839 [Pichia inconspicua]|uniref:TATA element modulatory factor 1 TATA binding domain-containing protein n=1 Tax=Pichia inconspicua TaxID=52247 RepID=A0A4T0X052_9ASCO|nr:hypothetical protein CANINC_002839 [[Candida] inconspicua]
MIETSTEESHDMEICATKGDEQLPIAEPLEFTPQVSPTESKPKAKKLSLQERLALAAQKKNAKKAEQEKDKVKETEKVEQEKKTSKVEESLNNENNFDEFSTFIADEKIRSVFNQKLQDFLERKLSESEKMNKAKLAKLQNELKDLRKENIDATTIESENMMSTKMKTLEDQVNALIEEGTKLSKRELLLNQTIKKLKAHEKELEEENQSYEKTIDELNSRIIFYEGKSTQSDQNERLLTEEKLAYETLKKKYDSLVQANESLTDELKEMKLRNLDEQLELVGKQLADEKEEHENLKDESEKLEINYDKLKEESSFTISELTKELKRSEKLLSEKNIEIKRLEEKVENLRVQNEEALSTSMRSSNIDLIQQQYDEARNNWSMIEKSYSQKINDLEQQNEELQIANVNYSKKIKILTSDLKQKSSDIEELQSNIDTLTLEIDELRNKHGKIILENKELEESLEKLKAAYRNETEALSKQLRKVEEDKTNLETTLKLRTDEINMNIPHQNSLYMQDLPSSSSLNYLKPSPSIGRSISSQRKYSIQFGESSTTPRQSASNSAFSLNRLNSIAPMSSHDKILRHQNSIISLDQNDSPLGIAGFNNGSAVNLSDNLTEIEEGNFTMESPQRYATSSIDEIPLGMDAEGEQLSTVNGGTPVIGSGTNVGSNIQLVKRLGAHVRILELEIATLKDETLSLAREKESATNEIAQLIEENNKVSEIKNEIHEKEKRLNQLNEKYEEVLVLLGEKEERVGELSADVDDLKDLLRQQVQQMVEMQEKINELSKNSK